MGFTLAKITDILTSTVTEETYIALLKGAPKDNGSVDDGIEASGNGYRRVVFGPHNTSENNYISNAQPIMFPEALSQENGGSDDNGFGTITHIGLSDNPSGGVFFFEKLESPISVPHSHIPIIRTGKFKMGLFNKE